MAEVEKLNVSSELLSLAESLGKEVQALNARSHGMKTLYDFLNEFIENKALFNETSYGKASEGFRLAVDSISKLDMSEAARLRQQLEAVSGVLFGYARIMREGKQGIDFTL